MSAERTDHAGEARRIVARTLDAMRTGEIVEEEGEASAAIAQVHATLALVEQQRIANLLTLAQFESPDDAASGSKVITGFEFACDLRLMACEALGLEPGAS